MNKIKILSRKWLLLSLLIAIPLSFGWIYWTWFSVSGGVILGFANAIDYFLPNFLMVWLLVILVVCLVNGIRRIWCEQRLATRVIKLVLFVTMIMALAVVSYAMVSLVGVFTGRGYAVLNMKAYESRIANNLSDLRIFSNVAPKEVTSSYVNTSPFVGGKQSAGARIDKIDTTGTVGELRKDAETNLAQQGYAWDKTYHEELGGDNKHLKTLVLRYSSDELSALIWFNLTEIHDSSALTQNGYDGQYDNFEVGSVDVKLAPLGTTYPW